MQKRNAIDIRTWGGKNDRRSGKVGGLGNKPVRVKKGENNVVLTKGGPCQHNTEKKGGDKKVRKGNSNPSTGDRLNGDPR